MTLKRSAHTFQLIGSGVKGGNGCHSEQITTKESASQLNSVLAMKDIRCW